MSRAAEGEGRREFLVFGDPLIEEAEIEEVVAAMRSGWLGTGPRVARFESDFKAYKGSPHAVAVSSCTAALQLSLLASGIGPGDEVITTALTFCATVNAIIHAGARPVLADVDPTTMNVDPGAVAARITPRTRAILPVHFAGRPCEMVALTELSGRHELRIIEDCAHAVETECGGRPAGTWGDFGCFSFYATKNLTAGEGGMVLARRKEDAERIRVLSLHGISRDAWTRHREDSCEHYEVIEPGFKYNMTDLQAAIAMHQLKRVEANWRRRREIWSAYQNAFEGLPIGRPSDPEEGTRHAYHLYTILVDGGRTGISRDAFLGALRAGGIGAGVHYRSIPEHAYYRRTFGWTPEDYPNAMRIGRQSVSLPLSPKLTDEDVERVIRCVRSVLSTRG